MKCEDNVEGSFFHGVVTAVAGIAGRTIRKRDFLAEPRAVFFFAAVATLLLTFSMMLPLSAFAVEDSADAEATAMQALTELPAMSEEATTPVVSYAAAQDKTSASVEPAQADSHAANPDEQTGAADQSQSQPAAQNEPTNTSVDEANAGEGAAPAATSAGPLVKAPTAPNTETPATEPASQPTPNSWGTLTGGSKVYYGKDSKPLVGLQLIDGNRYLFDADGAMKTGWHESKGATYYFGPATGAAVKWTKFFDAPRGNLVANLQDGGAQYYFNGNCIMQTGWIAWNGEGSKTYFGDDGAALSGWQDIDGSRYYFDPARDNHSVRWTQKIEGDQYYFNGSGEMQTGWITWNGEGTKTYFDPQTGAALSGWQDIDGNRYYFDPAKDNHSVRWTQKIEGGQYYFNGASRMQTGWITWNGEGTKTYFDSKTGAALSGWQEVDGATYYFDPAKDNHSARWTRYIDGKRYYFNGSSQMQTGFITWNGSGTHTMFADDGSGHAAAQAGWVEHKGSWYYMDSANFESLRWKQTDLPNHAGEGAYTFYFNKAGVMQKGVIRWNADGTLSFFNADASSDNYGALVEGDAGWVRDGKSWSYVKDSTPVRWSQKIDGVLYYFDGSARMVTGLVKWSSNTVNGVAVAKGTASFFGLDDGQGHMSAQPGWHKVGSDTYYMNPNAPIVFPSVQWNQIIDGKKYYFDGDSTMHKGWIQWGKSGAGHTEGMWSYFGDDGVMYTGKHKVNGSTYNFNSAGDVKYLTGLDYMTMDAQDFYSSTSYLIMANLSTTHVGIFRGHHNNWECIKYFKCCPGADETPTVTGTFEVIGKMPNLTTDTRAEYATQFYGGYFFHSILEDYDELGRYLSHGCIRCAWDDAEWIYDHIPYGTKVHVYW